MTMDAAMVRTPSFPSEVWLAIFDWATFVPFALDTHPPDPFGYPGTSSHRHIRKGIWESMRTKRHLVLVCQQWRTLATRCLYQAIIISEPRTLPALLRAICPESVGDHSSDGQSPAGSKGQRIKRVDIKMASKLPYLKDGFFRLLGSTPNLQILVVDPFCRENVNEIVPLFDALAAGLAPSLRVLHVDLKMMNPFHIASLGITKAINGRPLRVLTILSWDSEENFETMLDLPNIEHLDIPSRWTEAFLAARDVPSSLASLFLVDKREPTKRLAEGQLSIANDALDTLMVDLRFGWSIVASEMLMHRVAVMFPNLRCLIIHVRSDLLPEYLPPVEKLGLCVAFNPWSWYNEDGKAQQWKAIYATIERLVTITPTVQVVRLFHPASRYDVTLRGDGIVKVKWQTSATLLVKHNVRFEDIDGRLLHEHESA